VVDWIEGLIAAFDGLGPLGEALFVAAYVLAGLLLLPEWMFSVAAGALFGMAWGLLVAWSSAMTTALLAFLLTRLVLRERVEKRVKKSKWLNAVNHALPKEGWKVVALARLSPLVPFGLQNYLFGATKVHLRDYLVATALGILPGTIVAVFLGATGRALLGGGNALKWGLFAAGIVASVILSVFLGRVAKKRLGIRP
jgi:uncharacterized membrane protein YdjX (TVP38/TMEM64 family)